MVQLKMKPRIHLNREQTIKLYVVLILVVPVMLDLLFYGTNVARLSRIGLTLLVTASVLINHNLFLKNKLVGQDTVILIVALYALGTIVSLSHGGVLTPLFLSLLIFSIILALNIDCYKSALNGVGLSAHILSASSVVAIFIKINPTNFYLDDSEYPIFFKQIGIAGRNIGVFNQPNTLGEVAALSIMFIVGSKTNKFLLLAPIFCLMKCGSRNALIGIVVALFLLAMFKFLKKDKFRKIGKIEFPWILRILIACALSVIIYKFIQLINLLDPGLFTGRASVWQSTLALAKNNPFLGLGWDFESRAISSNLLNVWVISAHNNFLEIAFSTGSLGLFLFLILYSKILVNFSRLSILEKLLVVYISTSGLVEYTIKFTYPSITTYLFIFINIGSSSRTEEK